MNKHDLTMTFDDAIASGGVPLEIDVQVRDSSYLNATIVVSGLQHPLYKGGSPYIGPEIRNPQLKLATDEISDVVNRWLGNLPYEWTYKYAMKIQSLAPHGEGSIQASINSGKVVRKRVRTEFLKHIDQLGKMLADDSKVIAQCIKAGQLSIQLYDPANEYHRRYMRPPSSTLVDDHGGLTH
jgi:hypothetical protein